MESRRFDALARAMVGGFARRRFLRGLGAGSLVAMLGGTGRLAGAQNAKDSISLPCTPCGTSGECCLLGITGGGVVRTEGGDANLILFATELGGDTAGDAAGFVRWIDSAFEGAGITLESVGAITYFPVPGQDNAREVRGTMQANGSGEHAFVLRVVDAGPDAIGLDSATLLVGDKAVEGGGTTGFGYGATGTLVGGDLQLLNTVAPVG
jgi:hypothetical protein